MGFALKNGFSFFCTCGCSFFLRGFLVAFVAFVKNGFEFGIYWIGLIVCDCCIICCHHFNWVLCILLLLCISFMHLIYAFYSVCSFYSVAGKT